MGATGSDRGGDMDDVSRIRDLAQLFDWARECGDLDGMRAIAAEQQALVAELVDRG